MGLWAGCGVQWVHGQVVSLSTLVTVTCTHMHTCTMSCRHILIDGSDDLVEMCCMVIHNCTVSNDIFRYSHVH